MKKKISLLILLFFSLFLVSFVSADHTPIHTSSVFLPNDTTVGSCTDSCDVKLAAGSDCSTCETQCTCANGSQCSHTTEDDKILITFFYSETCPHCHEAMLFFDDLATKRDDFVLDKYEVVHNESDRAYAVEFCEKQDVPFKSVPTFFIGDKYFIGYADSMNKDIIAAIDAVKSGSQTNSSNEVKIPFFGTLDATTVSIPILAVVLGFIDGFNPCAFFVLFFLLSMLVYAKSRRRMALIGGIFVFFSGLIYFIFMAAWLNFFLVTSSLFCITTIAGLIALIIAIINIKDFFAFKKGVSLSISDKNRKSLIKKMRGLLKAESLGTMIVGTIVLAVSANLYELLCTAGFPMVFTKALTLQELPKATYYLYLLLYNVVYVIPLIVIVVVFTATLGSKKLSQEQGEVLKLLSGMMMLALGGMLVFKPGLLNNIVASVSLILLALVLTLLIVFIKRKIKTYREEKEKKTGARKTKKGE